MSTTNPSYRRLFWTLALIGFAADQASKYGIFAWLYGASPYVVIPSYFNIVAPYTDQIWEGEGLLQQLRTISSPNVPHLNHGALFGIGGDTPFGNYFFLTISLAAALGIIFWSTRPSAGRDGYLCFALGLILAGTLGNFYDRIIFGGVRDFFHFFILNGDWQRFADNDPQRYWFNWPVFNVADCCLVCGAILLVLEAFLRKPAPESNPQQIAVASESAAISSQA